MPETDFEKERRILKELEGKNIANYKVLLTALIRTTMENVRMMVALSAAGIGLVLIALILGRIHGGPKLLVAAAAFLGFFVSLVLSLGVLERNARYLAQSLKGGSESSLDLENCSQGGKQIFFIGCICLALLGLSSNWMPKWHCLAAGQDCPLKSHLGKMGSRAESPSGGSMQTKAPLNDTARSSSQDILLGQSAAQDAGKAATSATTTTTISTVPEKTRTLTGTTTAPKTPKPSGNAGNFKGGTVY